MAKFGVDSAESFGGQGGGGFFSLKNHKDVATVRFLYNDINDVSGYSVHEVDLNGKKRYVNCLREYGDPVDACPFCKAGRYVQVKYFVPLYTMSVTTNNTNPKAVKPTVTPIDALQTWERGKKFGSKLTSICSRYPNTVSHVFEIERNGQAGDQQTTYEIYETGETEGVSLEDFDVPNPIGTIILDKSAEEMETYLQTGDFGGDAPVRRENTSSQASGGFTRRTPATGEGGRRTF